MKNRLNGIEVMRSFLAALLVAFGVSFVAHVVIRAAQLELTEATEWLFLGALFVASFAATRRVTYVVVRQGGSWLVAAGRILPPEERG